MRLRSILGTKAQVRRRMRVKKNPALCGTSRRFVLKENCNKNTPNRQLTAEYVRKFSIQKCNCVQPCKSVTYSSKASYATYPSVEVAEILTNSHYKDESK